MRISEDLAKPSFLITSDAAFMMSFRKSLFVRLGASCFLDYPCLIPNFLSISNNAVINKSKSSLSCEANTLTRNRASRNLTAG